MRFRECKRVVPVSSEAPTIMNQAPGPGVARLRAEMEVVRTIGRSLAGKFDFAEVLDEALRVVGGLIGAEGASILLIDPETRGMSFYVAQGAEAKTAKSVRLPPGAGICGYVARTGEALIINDAQNDARLYKAVDQATGIVTRNLLCVPIQSGERMWGVLELINKRNHAEFMKDDMRLSEAVAAEISLALEISYLHREIVRNERMAAIGQTVSGLAHCIKNILNGIRSGSATIDRAMGADDFDRLREGWQTVRRNNEFLSNLVLDMLALARDSKPHSYATDVNDLAKQVCGLLADRAAERGINLTCVESADISEVSLDAMFFYRCLLNLLSNAVDACTEGGRICVRVYRGKGRSRFTVSVADNGIGMSTETRGRLFEEFFTTKGGRGTGLGLPVTRKLIQQMNGTIKCHSVLGAGTRFVFSLPFVGDRNEQ